MTSSAETVMTQYSGQPLAPGHLSNPLLHSRMVLLLPLAVTHLLAPLWTLTPAMSALTPSRLSGVFGLRCGGPSVQGLPLNQSEPTHSVLPKTF